MKKRQIKGRLQLDKLTIAKLSNKSLVRGGDSLTLQDRSFVIYCLTAYNDNCGTVTIIGATTVGDRPTEGQTKCNCDL
ncbi:class I lanthipeptide [uncultured Aquimarina sp.]|uniref:class I lanthipeptide n=1 Tax=uncultured Aquimarina sp. TaxID=575652 RepID=UPI00260B11FB|nr:class I lanthipeptide [uncultured Aquimarina sp.]